MQNEDQKNVLPARSLELINLTIIILTILGKNIILVNFPPRNEITHLI